MNNIIKGHDYELFIRNYIDKLDDVYEVYLWKDVPEQTLFDAGLLVDYNRNRLFRLQCLAFGKLTSFGSFHSLIFQ